MGAKTTARRAIERWWSRCDSRPMVGRVRHVHAHGVVVGYAASSCLVVKTDWRESEKHMREWDRQYPLQIVRKFAASLKPGDGCFYGYVSTETSGEPVAIPHPRTFRSASKAKRAVTPAASEAQK
jgi:hypothetical protein